MYPCQYNPDFLMFMDYIGLDADTFIKDLYRFISIKILIKK